MIPGSPEWAAKVTASKVAAILGLSPWDSPLTAWLKMHGDLPSDNGSNAEAKRRGHYLEAGCLKWWADQGEGPRSITAEQPTGLLDDWGAATPDALALDGEDTVLVEAKTDGVEYEWVEVPAHYAAQALWQLACFPDVQRVHFAVLHLGLRFREYVVERDDATITGLIDTCRAFYDTLAADTPPPLSGMACEYEALRKVHPQIDRDAVVVLPDDLVDAYLLDAAHEQRSTATKARVLDAMGTARLAKSTSGQTIARRQPKGDAVTLVRVAAPLPIDTESDAA